MWPIRIAFGRLSNILDECTFEPPADRRSGFVPAIAGQVIRFSRARQPQYPFTENEMN
jgi:hypothetical protein